MICSNCGQELNENMRYCNKCGKKIIQNNNLNNGIIYIFISIVLLSLSTFSSIYSYKNYVYFSEPNSNFISVLFLLSTICYPIFGIIAFIKYKNKIKFSIFLLSVILLGLSSLHLLLFFLSLIFNFRIL